MLSLVLVMPSRAGKPAHWHERTSAGRLVKARTRNLGKGGTDGGGRSLQGDARLDSTSLFRLPFYRLQKDAEKRESTAGRDFPVFSSEYGRQIRSDHGQIMGRSRLIFVHHRDLSFSKAADSGDQPTSTRSVGRYSVARHYALRIAWIVRSIFSSSSASLRLLPFCGERNVNRQKDGERRRTRDRPALFSRRRHPQAVVD